MKTKLRLFKKYKSLLLVSVAFGAIGAATLLQSSAATDITIDSSLPVPQNVRAYGDDKNIIVTWDPVGASGQSGSPVVGYYITYRPVGSSEPYKVRQQQVDSDYWVEYETAIQLQPLTNGIEYEINVQSAAGAFQSYPNGNEAPSEGGSSSSFARADGRVSNKATTYATTTTARVDDMRARLTGFFDDFDDPAGPFNELHWNQASTNCVTPGTAAAFLNDQFHSHNQLRSSCDRGGMATRPRATFDISGATEANPAVIQFDVDGATASMPRDTWYLDIIPLNARPQTQLPIDVTSHNDLFDTDSEDPGNTIRLNNHGGGGISYVYYDENRNSSQLQDSGENVVCADFVWCSLSENQQRSDLSPTAQPVMQPTTTPNVRNQWIIEITPTKMRVYINGFLVGSKQLPAAFVSQQQYTIHSSMFSYNTGKQYGQVSPYAYLLHWDNFGFTGPAPTEEIHNYLEGGPSGDVPHFATSGGGSNWIEEGDRATTIPIPDEIATLKDGKARLYFTLVDFDALTSAHSYYEYDSSHHILFNGKRYNFYNPRQNMNNPGSVIQHGYVPLAMTMEINQEYIIQGNNTLQFNFGDSTSFMNVHLELPYDVNNPSIPSYTQPLDIFGNAYTDIVRPPLTTCDKYWFIERDLGLPYEDGKSNLDVENGCTFLAGHSNESGGGQTDPPSNPSDLNSDGQVNIFDLSLLLSRWGENYPAYDIDSNGAINIIDLSILLGNWQN